MSALPFNPSDAVFGGVVVLLLGCLVILAIESRWEKRIRDREEALFDGIVDGHFNADGIPVAIIQKTNLGVQYALKEWGETFDMRQGFVKHLKPKFGFVLWADVADVIPSLAEEAKARTEVSE